MLISLAQSAADVEKCFPVMAQLRPSLTKDEFLTRVNQLQQSGFILSFLEEKNIVKAIAGFRISDCLSWGKFMYIHDLVTDADSRSKGYGNTLFDWLIDYAKKEGCKELHLDSGVNRHDAHRFYLRKRMSITCHHLSLSLINI
jgi:GNAT superfamily N-acetyltransferase